MSRAERYLSAGLAIVAGWAAVGCGLGLSGYSLGQRTASQVDAEVAFAQRPCGGLPCDRDEWAVLQFTNAGIQQFWPKPQEPVLLALPPVPDGLILDGGAVSPFGEWAVAADVRPADRRTAMSRIDGKLFVGTLGAADAVEVADGVNGVGWSNATGRLAVLRGLVQMTPGVLEIWNDAGEVSARYELPIAPYEGERYYGKLVSWSADDRYVAVTSASGYNPTPPEWAVSEQWPVIGTAVVDTQTGAVQGLAYPVVFVGAREFVSVWSETVVSQDPLLGDGWQERSYLRRGALVDGVAVAGERMSDVWSLHDADAVTGTYLFEPAGFEFRFFAPLRAFVAVSTVDVREPEFVHVDRYTNAQRFVLVPRAAVADVLVTE